MYRKLLASLMEGNERDVKQVELAAGINVAPSTFTNFFNYDNELSFPNWVLSIKYLKPSQENEIISSLADMMIADEDKLNCRLLMEYASTNRDFDLLDKLITTQRKSSSRENKDWAEIYSISAKFQQRSETPEKLLSLLENYQPKKSETRIFAKILKSLVLYMMREYKSMFRIAKSIENEVEEIKNPYLRTCYITRISEIFARGYLYLQNDIRKARFYANNVINSRFMCASFSFHMYHLLGTSFVFEDYKKSLEYFDRYRTLSEELGRADLANEVVTKDIYFLNVLWGKEFEVSSSDDVLESMHYFAKVGDTDSVENCLERVSLDDPFALCYLGMSRNDPEMLLRSIAKFVETGDKFFAELPRREILKHPIYVTPAEVVYNIKIG